MKLKTLTLKNIASFADADVHFDDKPLADAELFLISGITGTGKTTILDALSVVLFDAVPRYRNAPKTTPDDKKATTTLAVNDLRNMLRQGAGEGSISLTFEVNGVDYEAIWGIHRARSNAHGNYQPRSRSLRNCKTGTLYTNLTEVAARINELLGMSYDEFCRTTMLSQGEFAKFIESDDTAKGAILERITQTEIYAEIGRQIYVTYADKNRQAKEAWQRVDVIKIPTADEQAQMKARLAEFQTQLTNAKAENSRYLQADKWLADEKDLSKQLAEAVEAHELAQIERTTEHYIATRNELEAYDANLEAVNAYKQRAELIKKQNDATEALAAHRVKFGSLLADVENLKERQKDLVAQTIVLKQQIEAQAHNKSVYDNEKLIVSIIDGIVKSRAKIATEQNQAEKDARTINDELRPEATRREHELLAATEAEKHAKRNLDAANADLEATGLSRLRKELDIQQERLTALAKAQTLVNDAKSAADALAETTSSIAQNRSDANTQSSLLADAKTKAEQAAKVQKAADGNFEKHYRAVDHVKALRSHLHTGDNCPVCGNIINEIMADGALQGLVADAKAALDEAKTRCQEADAAVSTIRARIAMLTDEHRKLTAKLPGLQLKADKARQNAGEALTALQFAADSPIPFDELMEDTNCKISGLKDAIKKAEVMERAQKDAQKLANETATQLLTANKQHATAVTRLENAKAALTAKQDSLAQQTEAIGTEMQKLAAMLEGSDYTVDDLSATKSAIGQAAKAYCGMLTDHDKKSEKLAETERKIESADQALARVLSHEPTWSDDKATNASGDENPADALNSLAAEVKSDADKLREARQQSETLAETVTRAINPEGWLNGEQRVAILATLTSDEIADMRQNLKQIDDRVTACTANLMHLREQQKQHADARPALIDEFADDASAQIGQRLTQFEELIGELQRQTGEINQNIANAAELISQKQAEADNYKALHDEAERWRPLNDIFGDAVGVRMRNIAQRHVLGQLVRLANNYMDMLSDRYLLAVAPESNLILNVIDRYNQGAQRRLNTLSGGETFLSSLALALAMGDIGELKAIDTLFIDEGFGTLSGEPLTRAVATLKRLQHNKGRRVGIISHIEQLRQDIPVQIAVEGDGTRPSTLRVTSNYVNA